MPPPTSLSLFLPPLFLRRQVFLCHYLHSNQVARLRETRVYPETEVGAAIALSSGCLTMARFATSLVVGINELRQRHRAVGSDIDGLAAQISATESAHPSCLQFLPRHSRLQRHGKPRGNTSGLRTDRRHLVGLVEQQGRRLVGQEVTGKFRRAGRLVG